MANAGVEYMVKSGSNPVSPEGLWASGHGNVVKALTDFVAINGRGECRKDYISN